VSGRNIGASVRQRLLNKSRTQGRPFQELLQYFAMERFLYRLAILDFPESLAKRLQEQVVLASEMLAKASVAADRK
jgi:hypothetical protein